MEVKSVSYPEACPPHAATATSNCCNDDDDVISISSDEEEHGDDPTLVESPTSSHRADSHASIDQGIEATVQATATPAPLVVVVQQRQSQNFSPLPSSSSPPQLQVGETSMDSIHGSPPSPQLSPPLRLLKITRMKECTAGGGGAVVNAKKITSIQQPNLHMVPSCTSTEAHRAFPRPEEASSDIVGPSSSSPTKKKKQIRKRTSTSNQPTNTTSKAKKAKVNKITTVCSTATATNTTAKDATLLSATTARTTANTDEKAIIAAPMTQDATAAATGRSSSSTTPSTSSAPVASSHVKGEATTETPTLLDRSATDVSSSPKNNPHSQSKLPQQKQSSVPPPSSSSSAPLTTTQTQSTKKKKLTLQDSVYHHLLRHMKPFTLKDLTKAVTSSETALNYVMLSLVDKKVVVCKEFAGSKRSRILYWANYDVTSKDLPLPDDNDDEFLMMFTTNGAANLLATRLNQARHEQSQVEQQLAHVQAQWTRIQQTPSNADLNYRIDTCQTELDVLRQQISDARSRIANANNNYAALPRAPLSSHHHRQAQQQRTVAHQHSHPAKGSSSNTTTFNSKSAVNKPALLRRIQHMRQECKRRKVMCMDFVETIADAMEKKPKDVIKLLDLDVD